MESLTKKEHELYKYIKNHNITNITYTDLAKQTGINIMLVRNRILAMQKKGYIIRDKRTITYL